MWKQAHIFQRLTQTHEIPLVLEFPAIQASEPVLADGAASWFEHWKQPRLDF